MNRTVLVTGASRGIGYETARVFLEAGDRVVLNYLPTPGPCSALGAEFPGRALPVRADVSRREAVRQMLWKARERFGPLDILINNAGIAQQKQFQDITDDDWNQMLGVDLTGVFLCCQEALPDFLAEKSGVILNISSIWGLCGASCEVHYSAAKAAVIGLTKALAKELGPSGIRVNCIAPGAVDTGMNAHLGADTLDAVREETPLGRLGTPREIAETALFLASDSAAFLTGQVISPNGGLVI